jgi:2-phospho-L-lactate guanylyltransferase
MDMRVIAVPVKSLSRAKTRLAPALSPLERAALTLAMMEDVLDATQSVPGWETWVISPDEAVLEVTARRGATPIPEARPPLAAAVRQVEEEAGARGVTQLAVLLADVPLATPPALIAALSTLGPVVLAPSRRDGGTNLLLRRPPRAIPARFGRDSYRRHRESATARGLPASVVDDPALAFDLDLPEDIDAVLASSAKGRTRASLERLRAGARLPAHP